MFFYVARIAWFCLQPSSIILILLVVGAGLLFTRHQRAGRGLIVAAAVLFLVGGLMPLSNWLILPLEDRFARADLSGRPVSGIIVLGGAEEPAIATARHAHALNEAAERFTEVAALARRFPKAKIVFTSGSVEIFTPPSIGADSGALVLEDLGISGRDRLILERRSRNTWQNAIYTKALVKPEPGERWLLVTSAAHMPRAMGAFRKAGFPVEPWPVDYRTAGPRDLVLFFDAPSDGLKRFDKVLREWVGLGIYWLTGRSDALFPGPQQP
jgi:uncharacterized SAM-binding protein YcdF (DUF218 family)